MYIWKFTLPLWYTFPKSSTGGVWILNGVARCSTRLTTKFLFDFVWIVFFSYDKLNIRTKSYHKMLSETAVWWALSNTPRNQQTRYTSAVLLCLKHSTKHQPRLKFWSYCCSSSQTITQIFLHKRGGHFELQLIRTLHHIFTTLLWHTCELFVKLYSHCIARN